MNEIVPSIEDFGLDRIVVEELALAANSWVERDRFIEMIDRVNRENLLFLLSKADYILDNFGFKAHAFVVGSSLLDNLGREPGDIDLIILVEDPLNEAIYVAAILERTFANQERLRVIADGFFPYEASDEGEGFLAPTDAKYSVDTGGLEFDVRFPQPSDPQELGWVASDETEPVTYLGELGTVKMEKRDAAIRLLDSRFIIRTESI